MNKEILNLEGIWALAGEMATTANRDKAAHHPEQTDSCPALPRFPHAARSGWSREEREHVSRCAYCQKMTAFQWRTTPPGRWALAVYQAGMSPDEIAMDIHLSEFEGESSRKLIESDRAVALLARLIRKWQAMAERAEVFFEYAQLPAQAVAAAQVTGSFDSGRPIFQLFATLPDRSLRATLRETAPHDPKANQLVVEVYGARERAGDIVRVTVVGEKSEFSEEVILEAKGSGSHKQHSFGAFAEQVARLGEDCVLLLAVTGKTAPPPPSEPPVRETAFACLDSGRDGSARS